MAGRRARRLHRVVEPPADAVIISKATQEQADAYSAFEGTGLAAQLRGIGVKRLLIGGLATDYCGYARPCAAPSGKDSKCYCSRTPFAP